MSAHKPTTPLPYFAAGNRVHANPPSASGAPGGAKVVADCGHAADDAAYLAQAANAYPKLVAALRGMRALLDLEGNPPIKAESVRLVQSWMKATPHTKAADALLRELGESA